MMTNIYRRIGKWVEWTMTLKRTNKGASTQSTLDVVVISSSPSNALGMTPSQAEGPTQLAGEDDQPPNKNILLDKNYQDGLVPMIEVEVEVKKNKAEEPKDIVVPVAL